MKIPRIQRKNEAESRPEEEPPGVNMTELSNEIREMVSCCKEEETMFLRGPKPKIFAGILAVTVLIVGVYMTFFQSRGFIKTTAVITDVRMDSTGESPVYYPTVEYTADGKTYTAELDTASGSYRIGQTISVLYDPGNPSAAHDGSGFGFYLMIAGAVILAVIVFSAIREKQGRQQS